MKESSEPLSESKMPNERLYREFQNLERKIQMVLAENRRLKEDLSKSNEENVNLREEISEKKTALHSFQSTNEINKIVNNMVVGSDGAAQLKEQIEDYIKEIDKYIAHLAE